MTIALITYLTENNSVRLGSAGLLVASAGAGGLLSGPFTLGSATKWMEIGFGGPGVIGQAAIGSPSGAGAFLDSTVLVGNSLVSGAYSATVTLSINQAGKSVSGTLVNRFFKHNTSTHVYTPIGSLSAPSQNVNSASAQQFTLGPAGLSTMNFATNESLYTDLWMNILTNTMTAGGTFSVYFSNSATLGNANVSFVTPGYQSTTTAVTTRRHAIVGRIQ